ncbi:MAG TPA: hypothetical protein ENK28_04680 [Aliiroseovarius sp.]|nr:hypothetical protein [Aliiroseovarius sp.]
MTRLFDGVADVISRTFGDTVSVTPDGGVPRDIIGIFRDSEVPLMHDGGVEVIAAVPILSAHRDDVADMVPDGLVQPGNGKTYRAVAKLDHGSPDPRGFVDIQLEKTT